MIKRTATRGAISPVLSRRSVPKPTWKHTKPPTLGSVRRTAMPKFIRLLHSSPRQCQLPTHLGVAQVVLADNGIVGCVANWHKLNLPTETVTKGIHAGNWHSIWSQHSMAFIGVIVLQPSPSASGWKFLRELRFLKLAYQWHQNLTGRDSTLSIQIRMEIL